MVLRRLSVEKTVGMRRTESPICNCSDLKCPFYSKLVIPGLTRNPETFATSDLHYHWHFWIPACGDLCVTFRDSRESENPECAQIRRTPSP